MAQPNYSLLNTNIPAEAASSAMKGMQQVNALSAQRLENDAAQMAIDNALAEQAAYRKSGSLEEAQQNLRRGGLGKQAAALGQSLATQGKTQAETQKVGYEIDEKKMNLFRERIGSLEFNPSNANIQAFLEDAILRGEITPQEAQQRFTEATAVPLDQRPNYFRNMGVKVEERYKASFTPAIKEYEYGKKDPGFTNYQMNKAAAGAARSIVNLPPQEKAEQTERGKFLVDDYKVVSNAARVAARTLPAIETNLDLIDQGFKTGFSAEVKKGAANILGALGVENANKFATDAQVFQAKANETVLQRQLEQKGPQTESDAKRITQTGAQLTNTAEANKFILDVAKAQLKRDVDQRNFYDTWWKQNKTYDGAEDAWYTGDGGKSLFERPELRKYNIQTSASPQRQGSQQTTSGLSPAEQAELDNLRKRFSASGKK
jgi:hypothetical protein